MRKTFAKILGIMISCVLISQTMTVYAVTTQKDLKNKQSQINDQIEEAKEEKGIRNAKIWNNENSGKLKK